MAPRLTSALGTAILLGGLLAAPATAPAEEPVCYECHDAFPDFAHKHPPFEEGDCTACHQDHEDRERLELVEEGAALCEQCHDAFAGSTVHPPVADGECTTCHNPHGSANRAMLVADGAALCEECHDAFAGATVHPPVAEGDCLACHNPHASDNPRMLVAAGRELCAQCHDGDATLTGPNEHAALDEGCDACHRPHASDEPRLLARHLILDRIALFDPADAALCLECHDESSFTEEKGEGTNFRNGTRNLHALHLNGGAVRNKYGMIKKKDGQTCFACHEPHTSHQARLLRTEYECLGTACFTMRYVPNERGGTCVVGCHKPKTYSRDAQVAGTAPGASKVE